MFSSQKGQTLIEVVAVSGIITMSLVVILSLGVASISFSAHNKEEIIASNLAREGIESIRIIRDRSWLNNRPAFSELPDGNFIVDPAKGIFSASEVISAVNADSAVIDSCGNCAIYLNQIGDGNIYSHNSIINNPKITPYKRLIKIITDGNKKKITSQVFWNSKGKMHYFNLDAYLTDWR